MYSDFFFVNNFDMRKSKWTTGQINLLLQKTANGNVRMHAFQEVADKLGRRPNSVRNYYYKYHAKEKNKIVPFAPMETKNLLREIILGTSRGESVRSICLKIAGNNRAKMLRLQNKYRATLAKNPVQIEKISKSLEAQGYLVKPIVPAQMMMEQVAKMPAAASAKIIQMQMPESNKRLTDADINNLFMGLVRLIRKNASDERVESLKAEIERLKSKATVQKGL